MSWIKAISSVCLAGMLVSAPSMASAQGRGRGQGPDKPPIEHKAQKDKADKHVGTSGHAAPRDVAIDRDGHVRVIHDYVRGGSLPPGLAKREALPPGLRKQLHERGALPPGLQKRLIAVPAPLVTRLPPVPDYYRRYFAGDDLLIVDGRTNRIAAIIPSVWR